jgi:hypothetical protein
MKMPRILGALLVCAPLAFAAGAPASSEPGATHAAEKRDAARDAASPPAAEPDSSAKAGRAADPSVPASSGKGSVSTARDAESALSPRRGGADVPQHAPGPAARGNGDRLRGLLEAQARGYSARQSSQPVGSIRGANGNAPARGPSGASPAFPPALTAPNMAARSAANLSAAPNLSAAANSRTAANPRAAANPSAAANSSAAANLSAAARASTIGGPQAQGLGQVGGPAIGRPAHAATIDGTQLHHKF